MVTIYNCHSISVCILWIVCFCIKRNTGSFKVAILRCVGSFPGKVRTLTLPPLLSHDEITSGGVKKMIAAYVS